jgi:hypothetical protein
VPSKCQPSLSDLFDLLSVENKQLGTSGSHLNPSYSGGRDQEDHSSEPALGK